MLSGGVDKNIARQDCGPKKQAEDQAINKQAKLGKSKNKNHECESTRLLRIQ